MVSFRQVRFLPWERLGRGFGGGVVLRPGCAWAFREMSVILLATRVDGLAAVARCADAAVGRFLTYGSLGELVGWFYDDATLPGTDDWDESVLSAYWNVRTWRGVFRAWDECGRPEFDPSVWWGDDCDPASRRAAQA